MPLISLSSHRYDALSHLFRRFNEPACADIGAGQGPAGSKYRHHRHKRRLRFAGHPVSVLTASRGGVFDMEPWQRQRHLDAPHLHYNPSCSPSM